MRKTRLLFLFALLMTAVTGVWADDWTDIIINGNMEGSDRQCFFVKENGLGSENLYYARIQDGIGKEGSRAILVQSTGDETYAWDTQFFLRLPYELPAGTKYRLTFDYMANVECDCDLQSQNEPAEYIIWYINEGQSSPACSFKTNWDTYDSGELTVPADCDGSQTTQEGLVFKNNFQTISFNMAKNGQATRYIIDNIKFEILSSVASGLTKSPAPRVLPQYPVEINSMAIMGDFLGKGTEGNWNMENAWALTKDDNIWKLTKEFTAEAKTYEYKVFANGNMDDFTYPVEAKGQFVISEAGNYILNIFADPEGNTVSVKAVAPVNYTVKLKDGVTDADKWTIAPAEATTDGVYEGTKVTLTYSGRLKVKGVTATSDEAPAAPSFTEVTTFSELQTALSAGKNVKLKNDIVCTAQISITSDVALTIDGNGKKLSTTSAIRAFMVGSSATVAFKDLTLTGFVSGGGPAINNSGTIVLDGCTISNCHVNNSNGGGAIESSGKLYAINTTFSGNYSGEIGGAINNYGGSLYMSGCTFTNNYNYTTNSDPYYGGAIGINRGSEIRLINCSFSGNKYGTNTGTNDIGVYSKPTNYTIAGCTGATIASDDGVITPNTTGTATLDYSDLSNISFTYTAE